MKMAVRAMLVALATLALASPSFAATVAPTSYPFILKVDSFGSLYVIMSFITHRIARESLALISVNRRSIIANGSQLCILP